MGCCKPSKEELKAIETQYEATAPSPVMSDLEAEDRQEEYYAEEYEPTVKDWEMFTWGKNHVGQMGDKKVSATTGGHLPVFIPFFKKHNTIIQVSAGVSHMAGVTKNGDVFVWGSNTSNQAGQGPDFKTTVISKPMLVRAMRTLESKALMIACGETHTLCMLRNGLVYAWGKGDDGRLGLGAVSDAPEPTKLEDAPRAWFIAAGIEHSAILGRDQCLYTFGSGEGGRLGHGTHENKVLCARCDVKHFGLMITEAWLYFLLAFDACVHAIGSAHCMHTHAALHSVNVRSHAASLLSFRASRVWWRALVNT